MVAAITFHLLIVVAHRCKTVTAIAPISSSTLIRSASEISVRQSTRSARNASWSSPQSSVRPFVSGQARNKWRKGRAARRSHQASNSSKHPALISSKNIDRSSDNVEEAMNDASFRVTAVEHFDRPSWLGLRQSAPRTHRSKAGHLNSAARKQPVGSAYSRP